MAEWVELEPKPVDLEVEVALLMEVGTIAVGGVDIQEAAEVVIQVLMIQEEVGGPTIPEATS